MSKNFIIYNGYPLSFVIALTLHILLLAAVLYFQFNSRTEVLELVQPTVIKALFIDENPQLRNERALERQRIERRDQQQIAREREQQRDAEAERLRQEQARVQEQTRVQEQARAREQEAARATLREKQEQDRLRAEEQRKRESETEAQRQRQLAEAERQRQQQERAREREREQQAAAEAASAEGARTEFELVQSATAIIQQLVQENWSRPPSARNGMRAVLQIRMLPTGELLEASITESSNDPAFDRSAENAVYKAAPFRELQNLPINVFTANFRTLSLIFQPEDLLN
ncbi:MAG: cell envelope integrity protein TolA [Pseudohongiella sp.]|nr:cell envelope integrity protein TolA [Pseudohongiella sp.]